MSCLTKKTLFFIVLSIVCNPTFSDKIDECKTNIHQVFHKDIEPHEAFKIAMFSLSERVIKAMWNTTELLRVYKDDQNAILQYDDESLNKRHQEMLDYFGSLVAENQNNQPFSPSRQKDIIGYFKSLVNKFDKIPLFFQEVALSPKQYCTEVYGEENAEAMCKNLGQPMDKKKLDKCVPLCLKALNRMFYETKTSIEELEADKAFVHCYLNYYHLDFTIDNIFPASSSSSVSNTRNNDPQTLATKVMAAYFTHLMDVADEIVLHHTDFPKLFPTVEEYCRDAVQTET